MSKHNEVTRFMWYMFNKWSYKEAIILFGENLGDHIYRKYMIFESALAFYGALDNECRQKLVDRANEIYKNY